MKQILNIGNTIDFKYIILDRISAGSFGLVYQVLDNETKQILALKVDKRNQTTSTIKRESLLLTTLKGIPGVPEIIDFGMTLDKRFYFTQNLLGQDLGQIQLSIGRLSLKSTLMTGFVMLEILKEIHQKGIVHRDIKPDNIMTPWNQNNKGKPQLILIDFGISKQMDYQLNPLFEFIGSIRYSSRSAHKGYAYGFKDDLESFGYVLVHLYQGTLPWECSIGGFVSMAAETKQIGILKQQYYKSDALLKGMPTEFTEYFTYINQLGQWEMPNYQYLLQLFEIMMIKNRFTMDYNFDWSVNEKQNLSLLFDGKGCESINQLDSIKEAKQSEEQSNNTALAGLLNNIFLQNSMYASRSPRTPLTPNTNILDETDSDEDIIAVMLPKLTPISTKFIDDIQ